MYHTYTLFTLRMHNAYSHMWSQYLFVFNHLLTLVQLYFHDIFIIIYDDYSLWKLVMTQIQVLWLSLTYKPVEHTNNVLSIFHVPIKTHSIIILIFFSQYTFLQPPLQGCKCLLSYINIFFTSLFSLFQALGCPCLFSLSQALGCPCSVKLT